MKTSCNKHSAKQINRKTVETFIETIHFAIDSEKRNDDIHFEHAGLLRILMLQPGLGGFRVNKYCKMKPMINGGIWTLQCERGLARRIFRKLRDYFDTILVTRDWNSAADFVEVCGGNPVSLNFPNIYHRRQTKRPLVNQRDAGVLASKSSKRAKPTISRHYH
jgi:hypothetical protein